jgi:hypothetical protein
MASGARSPPACPILILLRKKCALERHGSSKQRKTKPFDPASKSRHKIPFLRFRSVMEVEKFAFRVVGGSPNDLIIHIDQRLLQCNMNLRTAEKFELQPSWRRLTTRPPSSTFSVSQKG